MAFDTSRYLGTFRDKSRERLQKLNDSLLSLERNPGQPELVQEVFREVHSLKGDSRMLGFEEIGGLAHALEDLLKGIRDRGFADLSAWSDLALHALDRLGGLIEARVAGGTPPAEDLPALFAALRAEAPATVASLVGSSSSPAAAPPRGGPAPEIAPAPAPPSIEETVRIPAAKLDRLSELMGDLVNTQWKADARLFELRGLHARAQEAMRLWTALKETLRPYFSTVGNEGAGIGSVGRLFLEVVHGMETELRKLQTTLHALHADLREDLLEDEANLRDLQQEVLRLRLLPVSTVLGGIPRAVRDLARELGREVEVVLKGEDTELDKRILEDLGDPLLHLVRNAVDHGIEPPDRRAAAGKPRRGRLEIRASQEGDRVLVVVEDDGAGIDPESIREAAVRGGLWTPAEAARARREELFDLLYRSGFSTRRAVTEVSGRGVGLDVVRRKVEALEGEVILTSHPGRGTRFEIKVPMTLALLRATIVRAGEEIFALPTTSVASFVKVRPEEVSTVEGKSVVAFQDRTVPLLSLAQLLGAPVPPGGGKVLSVLILQHGPARLGFRVEGVLREQEIVVKPLGEFLGRVAKVSGAAVLRRGGIVPVLSVPELMEGARGVRPAAEAAPAAAAARERRRRILVVEDSVIARELERNLLEAQGYEVQVANDGEEGWQRLQEDGFDLVLSDVQMPVLGGLDLTRRIKSDPKTRDLPVVLITTLSSDEDRRRGVEVGADLYIVKSEFDHTRLLEAIDRFLG